MKTQHLSPIIFIIILFALVIAFVSLKAGNQDEVLLIHRAESISTEGVCPPFHLLTEEGDTIDPVRGLNSDKPYSPKQTCGRCHDYELITQGYHFQQGKDEEPLELQAKRMQWVSSPGNYGGPWCSPAPLYRYLAAKENSEEAMVDMTSFDFVVSCGVCHPGGGSLEYDRDSLRYDKLMGGIRQDFTPGGINDLDGDYYKARWSESGVIEADCNICHLPDYDNTERKKQITQLNFRWAATAASGFGVVTGSVAGGQEVSVNYNSDAFNPDGTIEPGLIREPRNEACLWCHEKPGWKKRGANFRPRTDVHLKAGLRCVDCHPAGMASDNELIGGKEVHQFGKGDDPGGHVRDDLDNTMRSCAYCHDTGYMGAPVAKHAWLPPLHIEKLACQTCHIPERMVKSAHFVASDVFNPGNRIPTKGKHLWTFYDPEMNYWNHYGDLEMMGYDDKPTFPFSPELVRYKGMIYPANRVHSTWPAIQTEGEQGLMQPRMGDIYKMWADFFNDPLSYPDLAKIKDDTGDEVIEVNTPEEIEALISSVRKKLREINYPLQGKRVVWVMNNRIYHTGNDYTEISREEWEASPYGNVHTYNHDIFPAKSALGINGCTDCHSYTAGFFMEHVSEYPFNTDGEATAIPQYSVLGLTAFQTHTSLIRESYLKPALYLMVLCFALMALIAVARYFFRDLFSKKWLNIASIAAFIGISAVFALVFLDSRLSFYMMPSRFALDANHFLISLVIIAISIVVIVLRTKCISAEICIGDKLKDSLSLAAIASIGLTVFSGLLMLLNAGNIFYSLFDLGLLLSIVCSIIILFELMHQNWFIKHLKNI